MSTFELTLKNGSKNKVYWKSDERDYDKFCRLTIESLLSIGGSSLPEHKVQKIRKILAVFDSNSNGYGRDSEDFNADDVEQLIVDFEDYEELELKERRLEEINNYTKNIPKSKYLEVMVLSPADHFWRDRGKDPEDIIDAFVDDDKHVIMNKIREFAPFKFSYDKAIALYSELRFNDIAAIIRQTVTKKYRRAPDLLDINTIDTKKIK